MHLLHVSCCQNDFVRSNIEMKGEVDHPVVLLGF